MISQEYFEKLPFQFDINKIVDEVCNIIATKKPNSEQISLVYREGHKQDCWTDGIGTSFQYDKNGNPVKDENGNILRRFKEMDFKYLNPGLEGSELEKIYKDLKNFYNISRFRIAKIKPRKCLRWHKDEEIRIQIPVLTAPGCFIITEDGIASHLPADGSAYLFYARNGYHTAVNSDYYMERIHLLLHVC